MSDDVIDLRQKRSNGAARSPAVTDLGLFRGRATTEGVPVLPPPTEREDEDEHRADLAPANGATVARPAPRPPWLTEPAPAIPARVLERRPEAGPEVRVIRRVRAWSVARLSFAFALCLGIIVVAAAAILWLVAGSTGVLTDVESLVESLGFERFRFDGPALLRALITGGLIASVAAGLMGGIFAALFNLLTDLTGGIETLLEAPRPSVRNRIRARRARKT